MADIYDLVTPAELTGYARQSLADRAENQFLLSNWLPHRQVNDLIYRFNRGGGGLAEAASFRAYDAEPGFGSREGISRVTGEMPPIGRQYVLGEYDQLRLRNASEEIRNLLLRDAQKIAVAIDSRMEIARGDAIVNGSVTLSEDGVEATVDFDRDPAHVVTAAVPWDDYDAAQIIDDIETWTQVYVDSNGQRPGSILTSLRVARTLARNEQIRQQLYPGNPDRRLTREDINAWMNEFDLPPITTFDAQVRWNGVTQRIIPEDRFIFMPTPGSGGDGTPGGDLGATLWGTTLEAQEPEYGIGDADHPGMVVAAFKQKATPVRVWTVGAAIGIPIMANPNLTFVATVLGSTPSP